MKGRAIKGKEERKKRSQDGAGGGLREGCGGIKRHCQDLIGKYSLRASPPLTTNTGLITHTHTHTHVLKFISENMKEDLALFEWIWLFYVCECADRARFYHLSPSDVELVGLHRVESPFYAFLHVRDH